MNYEDPQDLSSISTISFGYFDYNQIDGGEDGMQYYSNIGLNHWAVLMDDIQYGTVPIGGNGGGKMALVDSGNTSIQLPATQFRQVRDYMKTQDRSLTVRTVEDMEILVSRKRCSDLFHVFSDLKFMLQNTQITIKPEGYLYHLGNQNDCFVGIQSIPDKYNQYRLGTVFLRNFYTGLDFENNMLVIGLNKGTTTASLQGKAENPFKPKEGNGAILFVITFIIVMFAIAVACFVRSRRLENAKTINFAHLSTDDMKKRYRNGVEIKPSEIAKEKTEQKEAAAPAGINDSMADEDPQELDQEENLLES